MYEDAGDLEPWEYPDAGDDDLPVAAPCRECGHEVFVDAVVCPECGVYDPADPERQTIPWVALGVAALIGLLLMALFLGIIR